MPIFPYWEFITFVKILYCVFFIRSIINFACASNYHVFDDEKINLLYKLTLGINSKILSTMKRRLIFILLACYIFQLSSYAQELEIAKITVEAGKYSRENTIVSANLDGLDLDLANSHLALYAIGDNSPTFVESQLDMNDGPKLWWKINDKLLERKSITYSLRKSAKQKTTESSEIEVLKEKGNLIIKSKGKNILQYNLKEAPLPDGVSDIYNRAGYIYPLWSPKGEVLTRIQPPDHYHHVGIWNPWTHTKYKGKVIDFWNLNKGEGTIKPSSIISTASNDLYGGFKVLHDHIDLNGMTPEGREIALKEEWNVRVWNIAEDAWLIDFISTMNCATDSALTITEYRYQGFGFRATEKWNDKTAKLLTSEGKDKEDGNSTRARWCDVNGISEFGTSGVLFITHPSNYNYPEPIRIWPVGANKGKENVFFNFNPSMDRDWVLEPGNDYQLKYRMFVYDGKIDASKAEQLWQDFAFPPKVSLTVIE